VRTVAKEKLEDGMNPLAVVAVSVIEVGGFSIRTLQNMFRKKAIMNPVLC
jgi:hypothetical protein